MHPIEILICLTLVLTSAYLSASEVALFSLSRFHLRILKERFRGSHKAIKRLLADPGGLLITLLVSNEIVNISIATVITHAFSHTISSSIETPLGKIPEWAAQTVLGIMVTTPVILLFCEITPKVIGARANQLIAPMTATSLSWIYDAFKPVRMILKWIVSRISHFLGKSSTKFHHGESESLLREEEFLFIAEEGLKEGAIHPSELELIRNIFELDDRTVMDIHTPLSQVQSLPVNTPTHTALATLRGARFSRIPITDTARKQVIGVLYTKDLLFSKLDALPLVNEIAPLMRKPFMISSTVRLNELFRAFKQQRTHMAVVTIGGPSGEALGIVTMADLLDAIFEDVLDEDEKNTHGGLR